MPLPEQLIVELADSCGKPICGSFALFKIHMPKKNSFGLLIGPSDRLGQIKVSKETLYSEAQKEADFFPMDYLSPLAATGEFTVSPCLDTDISSAISAHNLYGSYFKYPPSRLADLNTALKVLRHLKGQISLSVKLL